MTERITLAALVNRHRRPPDKPFLDLVEAASFLAFEGFIGGDELAELFKSELEQGEHTEDSDSDAKDEWSRASVAIMVQAGGGAVTLLGRRAPRLGAEPEGELTPIPATFFASEKELVVGLTNTLYRRTEAARVMYYEVKVKTDDFTRIFPTARRSRAVTAPERDAIRAYAVRVYAETGRPPSEGEHRAALPPEVSRSSVRAAIKTLDAHLQRERGK